MKDKRITTHTVDGGELRGANPWRDPSRSESALETAERILDQAEHGLARWHENHPTEDDGGWQAIVADARATLELREAGDNKTIVNKAARAHLAKVERAAYHGQTWAESQGVVKEGEAGEAPPLAWDPGLVLDLANRLGRKLEVGDLNEDLYTYAVEWLAAKPTPISFEYLADLRQQMNDGKQLSYPQAKGVLNCVVADARRVVRHTPATRHGVAAPESVPEPGPRAALVPGIYGRADGDSGDGTVVIYKVQAALHGSQHLYAKRLVVTEGGDTKGRFEYEKGAISRLQPEDRLSLADAKKYGAIYGVCIVCGALLTDEDSIARGIGPICAGKL